MISLLEKNTYRSIKN